MLLPKVSFVSAFLVSTASCHSAVSASASAHSSTISPLRINYNILANSHHEDQHITTPLLDALRKGSGLVSITDIPNNFHNVKLGLMSHLHNCITSIDDNAAGAAVVDSSFSSVGIPTEYYHDGTLRKSLATSTLPNESGAQPIKILDEFIINSRLAPSSYDTSSSCIHFKDQLSSFRSTVDSVTKLFATQLSHEMEGTVFLDSSTSSQPLLRNSDPNGVDYMNINQIVNGGVHLEHFHSYQKKKKKVGVDNTNNSNNNIEDDSYYEEGDEEKKKTIDFHTDQGFFIAFTPGMIVSPTTPTIAAMQSQELPLSNGFYIQDITSGERMHLVFTEEDELVFMMGDGVNQL